MKDNKYLNMFKWIVPICFAIQGLSAYIATYFLRSDQLGFMILGNLSLILAVLWLILVKINK